MQAPADKVLLITWLNWGLCWCAAGRARIAASGGSLRPDPSSSPNQTLGARSVHSASRSALTPRSKLVTARQNPQRGQSRPQIYESPCAAIGFAMSRAKKSRTRIDDQRPSVSTRS